MPITPDVCRTLAQNALSDSVRSDATQEMIAAQTGSFFERLAALTGHGVVPGVPAHPVLTVRFPTMEERAENRRKRRESAADQGQA
jgi:hypothetical protein